MSIHYGYGDGGRVERERILRLIDERIRLNRSMAQNLLKGKIGSEQSRAALSGAYIMVHDELQWLRAAITEQEISQTKNQDGAIL